jgi:hypothetical protein
MEKQPPKPDASKAAPGKQSRNGVALHVWLPPELQAALDAYLASLRPRPGKTAVAIAALEEFLASKGFWTRAD